MMQILILAVLLGAVPLAVGGILADGMGERTDGGPVLRWVGGQFLLWAGFQLICVPLVLKQEEFATVVLMYVLFILALLIMAAAMSIRRRARRMSFRLPKDADGIRGGGDFLLWLLFAGLLAFQLIQAVRLTYADGDDAYYVAVSAITENAETMYQKQAYTGGTTELDVRHGLAPFPIWISFLARMSGMPAVSVAHVVLPVVLISMTYAIFYLLGRRLFTERDGRLPLFLIFTEILVLFGDYSFSTVENFMIARSRQGKAALGSIVIPFILYLLLVLLQKLQEKERADGFYYLLLGAAAITGCLCSTLGAMLICMLIGITGLLGALCYREKRILLPMAGCCVPCVCYALLYLFFD